MADGRLVEDTEGFLWSKLLCFIIEGRLGLILASVMKDGRRSTAEVRLEVLMMEGRRITDCLGLALTTGCTVEVRRLWYVREFLLVGLCRIADCLLSLAPETADCLLAETDLSPP